MPDKDIVTDKKKGPRGPRVQWPLASMTQVNKVAQRLFRLHYHDDISADKTRTLLMVLRLCMDLYREARVDEIELRIRELEEAMLIKQKGTVIKGQFQRR